MTRMQTRRGGMVSICALAVMLPATTVAAMPPAGPEFPVNVTTAGSQLTELPRSVAADDSGDFVVVWSGPRSGGGEAVFARRYQKDGTPKGGEIVVSTNTERIHSGVPSVAMDAAGNFVVVWQTLETSLIRTGVFAQRFDSTGARVGGEVEVNPVPFGDKNSPTVAMSPDGRYVIAWASWYDDGSQWGVFAQRYGSTGTPAGAPFQVNVTATANQQYPAAALDESGNFAIAWASENQDGDGWGVYVRRFDAAGVAASGEVQVNETTAGTQTRPSIAMGRDGRFTVAWLTSGTAGSGSIFGRLFDASAAAVTNEFQTQETNARDLAPSVARDPSGNSVFSWTNYAGDNVFMRTFGPTGAALGSEAAVSSLGFGFHHDPSIATQGDGGLVIVWTANLPDQGGPDVYGQLFLADWDFGDAPASYGTDLASDGARHLVGGPYLGALVDAEPDGIPSAGTSDGLGLNDEDGVVFTSSLSAGGTATLEVTASEGAYLDAWIDFDGDGRFVEAGDQIFASQPLAAGLNSLSFLVPASAASGPATYARFRVSTTGGLAPTGPAGDGEVEDYAVTIAPATDKLLTVTVGGTEGGTGFVSVVAGTAFFYCDNLTPNPNPNTCTFLLPPGTAVTVNAGSSPDSIFTGFAGNPACPPPPPAGPAPPTCELIITDDTAVATQFLGPQPLTLTVGGTEGGTGFVSVTINAPGGGTTQYCDNLIPNPNPNTCTFLFRPGTPVTVNAVSGPDSIFTGFAGNPACPPPPPAGPAPSSCELIITDDTAVATQFLGPQPLTLTVGGTEGGTGFVSVTINAPGGGTTQYCDNLIPNPNPNTCTFLFRPGTPVTVNAVSGPDSIFTGFAGNPACPPPPPAGPAPPTCELLITDDTAVATQFLGPQPLTLTVGGTEGGTGFVSVTINAPGGGTTQYCDNLTPNPNPNTCTFLFRPGTPVTVSAGSGANSIFTGFAGNPACPPPPPTGPAPPTCELLITDDTAVAAQFLGPQPLTITVGGTEGGTGFVSVTDSSFPFGGGTTQYCDNLTPNPNPNTCTFLFRPGTPVTVNAGSGANSIFTGFAGNPACPPPPPAGPAPPTCELLITDDTAVAAQFLGPQPLTITVGGTEGGTGFVSVTDSSFPFGGGTTQYCDNLTPNPNPNTCTFLFRPGTPVTVNAGSGANSIFTGFAGNPACPPPPPAGPAPPTCELLITDDTAVVAQFLGPQTLTVTVGGDNGTGIVELLAGGTPYTCDNVSPNPSPNTCTFLLQQGTAVTASALASPGHTFPGFAGSCTGPGPCAFTVLDDTALSASFTGPQPLTIHVGGTEGGDGSVHIVAGSTSYNCDNFLVSPNTCTFLIDPGTDVIVSALAGPQSVFLEFGGACSGTDSCGFTIGGDTTLSAAFLGPQPLTVTVGGSENGNGSVHIVAGSANYNCDNFLVSPNTCTFLIPPRTPTAVSALAGPESVFLGFGGACTGTDTCGLPMDDDTTVSAEFLGPQPLTVTVGGSENGNGSVHIVAGSSTYNCDNFLASPNTCTFLIPPRTPTAVSALAGPESVFLGFGGACTGTDACGLPMDDDTAVSAEFLGPQPLTVTVGGSENGNGSVHIVAGSSTYNCDNFLVSPNTCTFLIPPRTPTAVSALAGPESVFLGFGGACTGTGSCGLPMDDDTALSAQFLGPQPLTITVAGSDGGNGSVHIVAGSSTYNCDNFLVSPNTCTFLIPPGTPTSVSALAGPESVFLGFGGACTGTGSCGLPMDDDTTVSVAFLGPQNLAITVGGTGGGRGSVEVNPPGQTCDNLSVDPSTCSFNYPPGTPVTLSAVADPSSSFAGWDGACLGAGTAPTCTVTVSVGTVVTAMFTRSDDWGDAPAPYPTVLADDGARHVSTSLRLGTNRDAEADGQPTAGATGDDLAGTDDEDGVVFTSLVAPGGTASLQVTTSTGGILDAWVDFDGDGSWSGPAEKVFDGLTVATGLNNLSFAVPAAAAGGTTYARFRLSSAGVASFTGPAPDGEVEDYAVEIQSVLAVSDVTVDEGGASAVFTVTLTPPAAGTVQVAYATANGTAVQPADYTRRTGTLTFAAGVSTQTVSVPVVGDVRDEDDEQFVLNLSSPTGAAVADAQGVATILDDDPTPGLSVGDVSVIEGDSGTVSALFTVSLSAASGRPVAVLYSSAAGTATASVDFTPRSGTLSFAPGTLTRTVSVPVRADLLDEDDETFTLVLSGPTNATIADGSGVATIADNDPEPSLSIGDATILEGHSGASALAFTATLSRTSGRAVTVDYATADGTATAADGDYAPTSGSITIAAGQLTATVTVAVNGDTLDEADETLSVNLTGASHAVLADAVGQGTIRNDDDPPPDAAITDVTVTEGNSGRRAATFTVTLAAPVVVPVTVDFATANGTAVANGDYTARTGRLTFPAGTVSLPLTVNVVGDTRHEMDESFFVNLTAASGAVIADGQGIGTIVNDDPIPSLSVADATPVIEGNAGTRTVSFLVTLSAASGQTVTVGYATANGPAGTGATAPGDYVARTGTLTFSPGQVTRTVTVSVRGDLIPEDDETFFLDLGTATNATLSDGRGQATILDDEP